MPEVLKTHHPLYDLWRGMWQRCVWPKHISYKHYGGKGVTVCDEWKDFWRFVSDMGDRPEGYTIERLDSSLGYHKSNCVWASRYVQARNNSRNIKTIDGVAVDSSTRLNGSKSLVQERISKLGWDMEKAISEPVHIKTRQYVTVSGITDTPTGWARRLGVQQPTMSYRVKKHGAEKAIHLSIRKANYAICQS